MRKSLLLIPVLAALAAVSACGNSSEKGRTLARIDGAAFTEGDLDLRLNVHEDARRKEILANPELRRAEFETFLHQRLYSLAGQASSYGKSKELRRHHELQDQRVMTQYYFEVFLGQQGGRTRADIEAYYAAAPERFTDDSGRTLSFTHAFSRVVDSLLVEDGAIDSFFQANVRNYADTAGKTPALDKVRRRVITDYLREHKANLNQNAVATLKAKHGFRLVSLEKPPTEREILAYYNANKASYESPETFELYHVELADEDKLAAEFEKAQNLEEFKALASRLSANPYTKTQQGRLGVVKRDFSLPYGVGVMPALFPALDEIESGRLPELVQNPNTQTWHAFWLVEKAPPAPKALDRVRALVVEDLKNNRIANVQPADSLAVIGKSGTVIREADVLFLRREIPPQFQARYTRDNLVDYLAVWEIFAAETKALGLDKERKLQARRMNSADNQWATVYRDSVLPATWEEKPSALKKAFKANRVLFGTSSTVTSWEPVARDVAASLHLTTRDYEIEYHTYPERYMRDSAMIPFAEAKPLIFTNLKPDAYARLDEAVLNKLKKRFKVRIEDPTLLEPSLEPAATFYQQAQDLHYERKLDQAMRLYERLRDHFPERAGLQDSVSFGIAQILIEQERYPQALAEYRRVNYLHPESANDYKALFMIGFIQAEHLRQDSAAVRSFESMLKKYPDSDLSDDADWMIRNIRSGGQLMPTLEEDLEDDGMSTETGT